MKHEAFLEKLIAILDRSAIAYRQYINEGKPFQLAQQLKLHNGNALQWLKENGSLLPIRFQGDIQSLITHYSEWSHKWEKLNAEKEFGPDEVFVFANDITFPKQAAQNLEAFYKEISQPPATLHGK
ncbi:MAG: hypothetical protein HOP10_04685 [Chitinophagaceae bacterium]|nr:hypothetical protein [Chitinophagaceae bacterium]